MSQDTENQTNIKEKAVSISIHVSIDNRPVLQPSGKTLSLYNRLSMYAKHKGLSEQDIIRYAVSMLLDKVGY